MFGLSHLSIRLERVLAFLRRLCTPPILRRVRIGGLGILPGRTVPVLVSVEGAGLLRMGRAFQFVINGGVWCGLASPGQAVRVSFRNLAETASLSFNVPTSLVGKEPRRPRVPIVRRLNMTRRPVGKPRVRSMRFSTPVSAVGSSLAGAVGSAMATWKVIYADGSWIVHVRGMPTLHLVSNDEETLRRVALRVASTLAGADR